MPPLLAILKRILSHPIAPFLLIAALLANAYVQPGVHWTNQTIIGELKSELIGEAKPRINTRGVLFPAIRDKDGAWQIAYGPDDLPSSGQWFTVYWNTQVRQLGFWTPILEKTPDTVAFWDNVTDAPASLDLDSRIAILQAFRAERQTLMTAHPLTYYANGGSSQTRILWLGVLNDLFVLSLFIALFLSIPLNLQHIRTQRGLRNSACPKCCYPRTGLTSSTCPECGTQLPPIAAE